MNGFLEIIQRGTKGLVFENSVFFPFRMQLLTVWLGKEMSLLASPEFIVDLCEGNEDVAIREGDTWTNIVFRRYRDLCREFGNGKGHIILLASEMGADFFTQERRHYIRVAFPSHGKEISFEIIDDPFQL
ncbi:MAG: hypothetical protein HGB01_05525 [Chlorobiaceae bacterium]|nr:hypothetical protein [Chlorobiaceae bacterium]NTV25653.1 hypothetical protein [Chlorobiaceae bacterium]